jgi:hypothetical protein
VALNSGCTLEEVRSVLDQTEKVWGTSAQIMVDALWTDLNKKSLHSWQDGSCESTLHNHGGSHIPVSTPIPTNNHGTVCVCVCVCVCGDVCRVVCVVWLMDRTHTHTQSSMRRRASTRSCT